MGLVVTTNSATLVNKGLEVIEAHLLFGIPFSRIEVTVHPQSVVHSLVEFHDGSTIAQASPPDMRVPIAWGLSWPDRIPGVMPGIDWTESHTWTFEPLDEVVFPAVAMAKAAGERGETFPAVFNAANEQAVHAFHRGDIPLPGIIEVISHALDHHQPQGMSVEAVLEAERVARDVADTFITTQRS
jgi:1-deoxy-D-xylulose-5-phosphate reductoisomerase